MRNPTASKSIGLGVWLAVSLILASIATFSAGPAESRERDRTLRLYFGHTGERGEFTFKRNGRYDRGEIRRINHLLRDWRRNEDADMDPQLLDLIWSIYRETGSRDYVHVVSAYRSLATNDMLRSRSNGVAKRSQHTAGKAMDFYIPGVNLAKLRGIAMRHQGGGVGYYPSSGSPFVHVDTGSVRSWPRMTRSQLLALFPDGETLYLPADGNPLPGYQRALARRESQGGTALAYLESDGDDSRGSNGGGWLSRVFGGGQDEVEDEETAVAAAPAPPAPPAGAEQLAAAAAEAPADARLPRARPSTELEQMMAQAATALQQEGASVAPGDQLAMASLADVPLPRSRPDELADSLAATPASGALAVQSEDALAVLAARAQENLVVAAQENAATLPSVADSAVLAGFAALEEPTGAVSGDTALAAVEALSEGQNTPRPRPLTLAFAAAGLPAAETPPPAPVQAAAPPAPEVEAITPAAQPNYSADADTLRLLVGTPATQDGAFAMPQPGGAPGLYTAPESAAAVMNSRRSGRGSGESLPARQRADRRELLLAAVRQPRRIAERPVADRCCGAATA